MNNKLSKLLPIFFVIVIIAVAGWVIGIETFKNPFNQQNETNNSVSSKDVLVYTVKENRKMSFYQIKLSNDDSKLFYSLNDSEAALFYRASVADNEITVETLSNWENPNGLKYKLSLDGKKSDETENNQLINRTIKSTDGKITAKAEGDQSGDTKIVVMGFGQTADVPLSYFFNHSFNRLTPLLFAEGNRYLYVLASLFTGDVGGPNGLYRVGIVDQNNISTEEIFYSGEIEKGANKEKFPVFTLIDPTAKYAYILEGVETRRKLIQIDLNTKTEKIIFASADDLYFNFSFDRQYLTYNKIGEENPAIQMINTTTGVQTDFPVSGSFAALSSDKRYLVYTKHAESFSDTPFTNVNPVNGSNRKIDAIEYHIFDTQEKKDRIIFTNKKVQNNLGNSDSLDGKEYSFVGLITQ